MRMLDPEGAAVMGDALAETGRGLVASQYDGEKRSFLPWKKRRAVSGAGARSEHGFEGGGANRRKASTGERIHT